MASAPTLLSQLTNKATSTVGALQAQLNRFAEPGAPAEIRFATPIATNSPLDKAQTSRVALVMLWRGAGVEDITADATRLQAMPDAQAIQWVTKNLGYATSLVQGYADVRGLPAVKGYWAIPGVGTVSVPVAVSVLVALVGGGGFLAYRRLRRRAA